MDDNLFIDPDNYSTVSQDYEKLLLEGIDHIQKLSGKQWTDYNYHHKSFINLSNQFINQR